MTPEMVLDIMRQMLLTALWLALPLLLAGFVIGIVISLLQVVTSMQDSAFGTVPRLATFLAALILAMPWMLSRLMSYTTSLLGDLGKYAR